MERSPRVMLYSNLSEDEQRNEKISDCCSMAIVACRMGVNFPFVLSTVAVERGMTLCANLGSYLNTPEKTKRD